ncbi:Acetylcholinesterase [Leucoagaricus sp. SymC.cos]|nr:Acetylcholinesterase [Leucoagaricus sp. SymC.cos]
MFVNQLRGLLALISTGFLTVSAQNLDIKLPTGTFRGTSVAGSGVEKWLGIPFAQPPVGPLRFKAPVAITQRSSAVKNATTFGNACPQLPTNFPQVPSDLGAPMNEDCLYLNVCCGPFDWE